MRTSSAKPNFLPFLSTPSARRATLVLRFWIHSVSISIHALREEGDAVTAKSSATMPDFYPRPPRGGRLRGFQRQAFRERYFYPRPPRGGRPAARRPDACAGADFYPRPPRGGRRRDDGEAAGRIYISIHALREEGDPRSRTPEKCADRFLSTPSARRATC